MGKRSNLTGQGCTSTVEDCDNSDIDAKETEFKREELIKFDKGFWLMAFDCLLTFAIIET